MFSPEIFISAFKLNEDNFSKRSGLSKRFYYQYKNETHIIPVRNNGKESIKAMQPKSIKGLTRAFPSLSEANIRVAKILDELVQEGFSVNNISQILSGFPDDIKSLIMRNHSFFV